MSVICVLLPRFELLSALDGDRTELLKRPIALAPEPGRSQFVGEASGAAEVFGVRSGVRVGEALSRCPELILVSPDPERSERLWERVLERLEGIGAAVESGRPGCAFFESEGLHRLWGGDVEGVIARARRAIGSPLRIAAAPSRFCAQVAAGRARSGRPVVIGRGEGAAFLAPLPVGLLGERLPESSARLPEQLERLGVSRLGQLAGLGRAALADRFGAPGLLALSLARGDDSRLRLRPPRERIAAELELPEAAHGAQLDRALELLVDRLLAERARDRRPIRRLRLSARLAGGGGWRLERVLRRAAGEAGMLRLALAGALDGLPGPAERLRLEATELGAAGGDQFSLALPREQRRRRLAEAVLQVRAAAGREAVLRVLEIDPGSRLPERRIALTPFPAP